jgi:hypothetical protein
MASMTVETARRPRTNRYGPLHERLAASNADSVTLPVDEIDALCGGLPAAAKQESAWWANDPKHLQAKAWMQLGFQVSAVDPGGAVRFVRQRGRIAAMEVLRRNGLGATVIGRLDRRSGNVMADPGAAFLLADTYVAVLPRGSRSGNRIRPAAGESFLLACWFTLRGTETWGRLVAWDGKPLSRDEGLALIAEYRGASVYDEAGRAVSDSARSA